MMDIRFQAGGSGRWKADAALAFFFEGEGPEQAASALEQAAPWLGIAQPCAITGAGRGK